MLFARLYIVTVTGKSDLRHLSDSDRIEYLSDCDRISHYVRL